MTSPRAAISAPGLADPRLERRLLTAIAEAARLAAGDESKTRFLLRLLSRIREPAIVFTEYRDTLARLEQRVTGAGHAVAVLHGGMTPAERGRVQQTFNERGGILLATDAASEGLNLHHRCRVVIDYELPWNPSRLEQRAGRVDRLGQTRRVHELALVAAHTAERLVVAPLVTRLAATRTRGRMLDALTESRVAAAVMTHAEPGRVVVEETAARPDYAVPPPDDLAAHAVREAARLEHHRSLAARSSPGPEPDAGWRGVASSLGCRTRVPPGLYLVIAFTLAGTDGSTIHAEARLVRGTLRPDRLGQFEGRRPRRLRDAVLALTPSYEAVLRSLDHQLELDSREAIFGLEAQRLERLRQRETAMASVLAPGRPSTARLLVQAGLFDRRSLRAAALHATSAAAQRSELDERIAGLADSSPPESRAELIAVLLVPDRR